MVTRSAKKRRTTVKRQTRQEKAEAHAVREYANKYETWSGEVQKLL
jgi:hypothetical protein